MVEIVRKCIKCGEPIAKIPITTYQNGRKVILWKNLFKMSIDGIVFFVILIVMILAYRHDTAECREILNNPIGFCNQSNACKVLAEMEQRNTFKEPMHNPEGLVLNFTQ